MMDASLTNKEKYAEFCKQTYVPIYSKPWWLDAICGPDNWDVWNYETGGNIVAAMPYYKEKRGSYNYITKAPLTQNNGIIFKEEPNRKLPKLSAQQEKIIDAACDFIESLGLDVYEQQYQHTFVNWSPFFWNNYTCVLRYSYIIEDTSDIEKIWDSFTPENRNVIRKGQKLTNIFKENDPVDFYKQHERIYIRQGLKCPFSEELWMRLFSACEEHSSGQIYYAKDGDGNLNALMYLIWDERSVYLLMGGAMPEFSGNQAYSSLIFSGIKSAGEKGLSFDFEGSMIKRIARSYREYGAVPMPYYRIRKVFNPEIVRKEAENYIKVLEEE